MKLRCLAVFLVLCLSLSGCARSDEFSIENYEWEFSVAINSDSGAARYCADNTEYPGIQQIDLTCEITPESIILSTPEESWELEYQIENLGIHSALYRLGENEYASVSLTEYEDGTSAYTLVISCGGYGLYFYES